MVGGGDEVDIFICPPVETDDVGADEVAHLFTEFFVGEDIVVGDIGEERENIGVEYIDAAVKGGMSECARKGKCATFEFLESFFVDIYGGELVSHKDAQVSGLSGEFEVLPAQGFQTFMVRPSGFENVKDGRFVAVDSKARDSRKQVYGFSDGVHVG